MIIEIADNTDYDEGFHPEITEISFSRRNAQRTRFFEKDRFPNLVVLRYYHGHSYTCNPRLKIKCSSLKKLWCEQSHLEKLELNCPSLQELNCSENLLKNLRLKCPHLVELNCAHNKLEELDLDCPSLQILYCDYNRLTKLELNYQYLLVLSCCANNLTELEFNCPSLQDLWCGSNELKNLNGLEFCSDLRELSCSRSLKTAVEILNNHFPKLYVMHK
jgi:Leucine-rich repeat (LRR) protein